MYYSLLHSLYYVLSAILLLCVLLLRSPGYVLAASIPSLVLSFYFCYIVSTMYSSQIHSLY
jgi:hypothetical protein